jgi:general secretion pathway protein I
VIRRRGFTLIEVLVSLAVLALAAIVLGAAYVNTLEAHRTAAQRAAVGTPLEFLREAILNEPEREKIEAGGDLSLPDNRRLRWEATLEASAVPDLFRVVVTGRVEGGDLRAPEEFAHTLMLLRPTWSDAQEREQIRTDWRALLEKRAEEQR